MKQSGCVILYLQDDNWKEDKWKLKHSIKKVKELEQHLKKMSTKLLSMEVQRWQELVEKREKNKDLFRIYIMLKFIYIL